ncbi:hypothetical protein F7725_021867 [Dissostichus mawsoni]|uniref:PX domain-containing protein n=1 Tax=Dissostichus mawsoni TaxID=36200 RepID=A0A7J5ZGI0_DISMA|nr:hypothetical protein F7725_021867 [Dissostichus mawsoni]
MRRGSEEATSVKRRMAEDGREESVAADDDSQHTAEDGRNGLNNTMVEESPTLLRRMEICVAEAEKRSGKNAVNMQETFTVYLIETRPMDALAEGRNPTPDSLWRRYSEFELLRNYLLVTFPYIVVPPLPEKRAEFVWHKLSADNMDPDFVERRRVGLENFLLRVASHPVLSNDKILHHFLTEEHGWKEVVYETGFQAKADSRLKALSATFRVRNPDKRFMDMKHYSDELQSHTSQLLRARARVADRLYGVYKVHGNYGRVFRAVCRKHELTQFELEMATQDLISKKQQHEELSTGAPEQREARLKLLEELIEEGEEAVKDKTVECEEHVEKAWVDMQRFTEQKDKDLREALINYAVMQVSMCKKGIQMWSNAKECFLKM